RFTAEFGDWWPVRTHSIGGERVERVVFEPHAGGRIFEQHRDGRRFEWGRVLDWEPPRRVRFTWHPSRDESTAQDVEIAFEAENGGTRVTLISTGWERWGAKARRARKGYHVGWGYVLNVWMGRRTAGMRVMDGVLWTLNLVQKFRGGVDAEIAQARGEIVQTDSK
ncbi:MAG: SRPBCC domain-containing protein, partial [Bryobacteraceae bacterium]